jgi:hypothetical protein
MAGPEPSFPNDSTLPLLVAFALALAFLGVVVAIGLSDGADGAPAAAKTSTDSLADTTPVDELPKVMLTLDTAGAGSGTVRVAGVTRVCTAECRFRLDRDTSATIIARAARGSTFVTWTGSCGGGRFCTVLLDRSRTATALFSKKEAPPPEEPAVPEGPDCEDKIDNDGDGKTDIDDDDCLLGEYEDPADNAAAAPDDTTAPPAVTAPPPAVPIVPPPVVPPPVVPPPPPPPPFVAPPPPPPPPGFPE